MPAHPSVLDSIDTIRREIDPAGKRKNPGSGLYAPVTSLFRRSEEIVGDAETLAAVLAFAPEIEAFRGKGAQTAAQVYARSVADLAYDLKVRLPCSERTPERFPKESEVTPSAKDVVDCLEKLAAHAYARTQGKPVRSQLAAHLRSIAWQTLANIAEILRRPEHLAHALAVAADTRASSNERRAAIGFLVSYWESDDPDEATATLLRKLESAPPDRGFLVTVRQAQIDLGLSNEFAALAAVDDWADDQEEE